MQGKKLIINVDVSNSCFWNRTSFERLALHLTNLTTGNFEGHTRHFPGKKPPNTWAIFKRFNKSKFYVQHKGRTADKVNLKTVFKISDKSAESYKFEWKNKETGQSKEVSVKDYFHQRYGVYLNFPYLPLVEVKKGEVYPMEVCMMGKGQRYPAKLNEDQTAKMIKFAATRPRDRMDGIRFGLSQLNWGGDRFLKNYGKFFYVLNVDQMPD